MNSYFRALSLATQARDSGLQNTMKARASNHLSSRVLTRYNSFFIAGYSLVWYILTHLFTSTLLNNYYYIYIVNTLFSVKISSLLQTLLSGRSRYCLLHNERRWEPTVEQSVNRHRTRIRRVSLTLLAMASSPVQLLYHRRYECWVSVHSFLLG